MSNPQTNISTSLNHPATHPTLVTFLLCCNSHKLLMVTTCEYCPSEPKKLHCLDITQINEAIQATKLQPLSQDSMEQQTVSKEAYP